MDRLQELNKPSDLELIESGDVISTAQQELALVLKHESGTLQLLNRIGESQLGLGTYRYDLENHLQRPIVIDGTLAQYYGVSIIRPTDDGYHELSERLDEAEL